jgi:hypothetical protein
MKTFFSPIFSFIAKKWQRREMKKKDLFSLKRRKD